MMISPETYIDELKNKTYKELIKEKNKLLKELLYMEVRLEKEKNRYDSIIDRYCSNYNVYIISTR